MLWEGQDISKLLPSKKSHDIFDFDLPALVGIQHPAQWLYVSIAARDNRDEWRTSTQEGRIHTLGELRLATRGLLPQCMQLTSGQHRIIIPYYPQEILMVMYDWGSIGKYSVVCSTMERHANDLKTHWCSWCTRRVQRNRTFPSRLHISRGFRAFIQQWHTTGGQGTWINYCCPPSRIFDESPTYMIQQRYSKQTGMVHFRLYLVRHHGRVHIPGMYIQHMS